MKELTSYNRVAGYLNKIFDLLNDAYFESALSRPTITIQSTPKAYGHFSLREDTWLSKNGATHEINIGAGTLSRPIEEVTATLLHEMVHYYNCENGVQDCSRGNTYHNRRFKECAESHGLCVEHSDKYGWSHTAPSDGLLEFVLNNGLTDILLNRNECGGFHMTGTGAHNGVNGGTAPVHPVQENMCVPAAETPSERQKRSTLPAWTATGKCLKCRFQKPAGEEQSSLAGVREFLKVQKYEQ